MENFCSNDVTQLARALIQVQKQLVPATKDAINPYTRSRYATLNAIMESCREALLNNGIWLTQITVPADPGFIGLLTKLTHAETGQYQAALTILPLQKPDCQAAGSAITYARRYALTAMLGMVTEDDDDGEAAKLPPKSSRAPAPQPQQPFPPLPEELPQLAGVTYRGITTSDGSSYIVATGNTMAGREKLHAAGFRWDASQKYWKRAATA